MVSNLGSVVVSIGVLVNCSILGSVFVIKQLAYENSQANSNVIAFHAVKAAISFQSLAYVFLRTHLFLL